MSRTVCSGFVFILFLFLFHTPARADFEVLHSLPYDSDATPSAPDGQSPTNALIWDGSTLYGTASRGGSGGWGTIFSMAPDGSGFTLLHEFGDTGGRLVHSSLTLDGATLYGTTAARDANNQGTIFSLNTDGSGFVQLYQFSGVDDGARPFGQLLRVGATLYGMTFEGGDSDLGVLYKVGVDGSDFALLHEFTGGAGDGANPLGSLITDGTAVYGTTRYGGDADAGVLFSIQPDGSAFEVLHEFAGGPMDGSGPRGLTLDGATLFGMTSSGGDNDAGTLYSIEKDGSGYSLLYDFAGAPDDVRAPLMFNGPALVGSTLFASSRYGGADDKGTVFSIGTDGSGLRLLHEFAGPDGTYPVGAPIVLGETLYGTASNGYPNIVGTVFAIDVPEPSALCMLIVGACCWWRRERRCDQAGQQRTAAVGLPEIDRQH